MSDYPSTYLTLSAEQTKQLAVAIIIDGVPDVLTNVPVYTAIRYGIRICFTETLVLFM